MLRRLPRRSDWHSARRIGLHRTRVGAFRVYAMLLIIVGHSELLLGRSTEPGITAVQFALSIVSRAAVPLFLLLAGEHIGPRLLRDRAPGAARYYITHLALLYGIACLGYWLIDAAKLIRSRGLAPGFAAFIERQAQDPWGLLLHGPRAHLWFLVVLMLVVAVAGFLLARARVRAFVAFTAVLYGIGLAIGPYHPPTDVVWQGWWAELLLQAPLFFAVGVVLGLERVHPPRQWQATVLIAAGLALHTIEVLWISSTYGTRPLRLAMLAGTVPYAIGVGILALSSGATRLDRWAARLARYVPAVYISHVFLLETLRPPPGRFPELAVRLVMPLLAVVLSFGGAWLVARLRHVAQRRRRMDSRDAAQRPTTSAS